MDGWSMIVRVMPRPIPQHAVRVVLAEADRRAIEDLARREDRSLSGQVRKAIHEHLSRAGRFASAEAATLIGRDSNDDVHSDRARRGSGAP